MDEENKSVLKDLYDQLVRNVKSATRSYRLEKFETCFIASEAVDFLVKSELVKTREEGVKLMLKLEEEGLVVHVTQDRKFGDGPFYFRFTTIQAARGSNQEAIWEPTDEPFCSEKEIPEHERRADLEVSPLDNNNCALLNNVHPRSWKNPTEEKYNLLVIGAGAGGLISAIQGGGLGIKTALIEKHLLGGDCLNVGCVPSKALLRCAKAVKEIKNASKFGVEITGEVKVDFAAIMERMRALRAKISPADSCERYTDLGVSVFQGKAHFTGKHTVEVHQEGQPPQTLTFLKAIIATGARAAVPPFPGIEHVNYLTNASLFNLTELPKRLAIIGSGPIGTEMAQAFANFGSEVTIFDKAENILVREDKNAADIVRQALEDDGVKFVLGANIQEISEKDGVVSMQVVINQESQTFQFDKLLVSAGRRPNIEGLSLEAAGVKYTERGVTVSDSLQTSNADIYAVGDVCSKYQFTHIADAHAKIAFKNAMLPLPFKSKASALVVPWCTYTSPEIAHVGQYAHELTASGVEYSEFIQDLSHNDRNILESVESAVGFVKLLVKPSGKILGCTIVAENAGDLISEVTACMVNKVKAGDLSTVIHPYPTVADSIRLCAGQINKAKLTHTTKKILRKANNFKNFLS